MDSNGTGKKEVYRIENDVSARISTAQVIVSTSAAVRQLIDNSLDASAGTIEVRVKNNGFDSVEVIDDGTGIEADSFTLLCKPHATSKLTNLSDFNTLSTLGFRGEALNALCALASLTVITKDRSASLGTKLRFDHCGNMVEQSAAARSVGTTVLVENLFETLPVRRKEFEKTAKREFGRLLTVIQCFALSRPDVKFVCSNIVAGWVLGKEYNQYAHQEKHPLERWLSTYLVVEQTKIKWLTWSGAFQLVKYQRFTESIPKTNQFLKISSESIYCEYFVLYQQLMCRISGFVSSCEHGFGRCSTDRQFVYVNQRPVDYPKICRLVNEIYQQYNRSQYPTLVLYIEVPPGEVDVNVTPDKRMVFFEREKELLALIRSSFLATFHPLLGSYTSLASEPTNIGDFYISLQSYDMPCLISNCIGNESANNAAKRMLNPGTPPINRSALFSLLKSSSTMNNSPSCAPPEPKRSRTEDHRSSKVQLMFQMTIYQGSSSDHRHQQRSFNPSLMRNLSRGFEASIERDSATIEKMERTMDLEDHLSNLVEETGNSPQEANLVHLISDVIDIQCPLQRLREETTPFQSEERPTTFLRAQQQIAFSMTTLRDRIDRIRNKRAKAEQASQLMEFNASIAPEENMLAEEELDRILKKTDFADMSVIGQFNKGFIITRLRDHLFLIDQHASDEKYNFERFQKKARVETQKMLHPKPLDLGAVQESVLKDNLEILEANGFGFEFQEKEDGCSAALLVSSPVLHSWQFDKSDIEEILAVVSEFPGVMYRPAKLRRIFASRACRKSVMIGTALSTNQMQTVVESRQLLS
ncbi:DNA mismatch repair protein [Necator americanus]|uniref:DNA mismatch repair protein n=1 Tax=Necator americanus TaxID=51031 RepID=W2TWW0_NECAM|nr:DNA mismatch repair protein [Necator americanus]ETN85512.1 DNA mismatch repair protein [Necator americanus]